MTEFDLSRLEEFKAVWRKEADRLMPVLQHKTEKPKQFCQVVWDDTKCQGIDARPIASADELSSRTWKTGDSFILDFGEHHVGFLSFEMYIENNYCDSPTSLRILAAELPYELTYDASKFHGTLSQGWIQEEFFKTDELPATVKLPRRYAFRYLLVQVGACPGKLVFDSIECDSISSRNYLVPPPNGLDALDSAIWTAGCRTLRDCMQLSLEDGPKRDRRLWLGDLFLEAKTNAVTYKNWSIVEHCVYLLAANCKDNGMIAACAFENPNIVNLCYLPDYAMIFPALLVEHTERAGDSLAKEFYDLALHQVRLCRTLFDDNGRIIPSDEYWFFIDHEPTLDKNTPEACVMLYSLDNMARLAKHFGKVEDAEWCRQEFAALAKVLREKAWDAEKGVLLSGDERQISEASQCWGILSGLLTPAEGFNAINYALNSKDAVHAHTPFLKHFVLEAIWRCGGHETVRTMIRDYWGRMISLGADTFWEAYRIDDNDISPYKDPFLSSACHAWSCTPCIFMADGI